MFDRQKHQQEVHGFLQKHFDLQDWSFSLPRGTGMETYFVRGNDQEYFVKISVSLERYQVMADIGLTPPVLASGQLESGPSIIVRAAAEGCVRGGAYRPGRSARGRRSGDVGAPHRSRVRPTPENAAVKPQVRAGRARRA